MSRANPVWAMSVRRPHMHARMLGGLVAWLLAGLVALTPGPAQADDGPRFYWDRALWYSTVIVVVDFPQGCSGRPRIVEHLLGVIDERDLPEIDYPCKATSVMVAVPEHRQPEHEHRRWFHEVKVRFDRGCGSPYLDRAYDFPENILPLPDLSDDCITPGSPQVLFLRATASGLQWTFGQEYPAISILHVSPTDHLIGFHPNSYFAERARLGTREQLDEDLAWVVAMRAEIDRIIREQSGDDAARSLLELARTARAPHRADRQFPDVIVQSLVRVSPLPAATLAALLADPSWSEHHHAIVQILPQLAPQLAPETAPVPEQPGAHCRATAQPPANSWFAGLLLACLGLLRRRIHRHSAHVLAHPQRLP